jgi:hypothetical protein
MKQDRFLIGILVFIALLVVAALVLFFLRPGTPGYLPDDTPEGVVNNYIHAIQEDDLQRAYTYLSDLEFKPTESAFSQALLNNLLYSEEYALQIEQVQDIDENEVWVMVSVHYLAASPFETGWSNQDHASLIKQEGKWKLTSMPYPFWSYDWYQQPYELPKP